MSLFRGTIPESVDLWALVPKFVQNYGYHLTKHADV